MKNRFVNVCVCLTEIMLFSNVYLLCVYVCVEDYDDTTTTMTSLCLITFFFLQFLANFILACFLKNFEQRQTFLFFLFVCVYVTILLLIIDFPSFLRMLNSFLLLCLKLVCEKVKVVSHCGN